MKPLKFPSATVSFHTVLKTRVDEYFSKTGKASTGNYLLWIKAALLLVLFTFIYIHLVFFTPVYWQATIECIIFGGIIAAIGFNIMHDGAHGSFSQYPVMNKLASLTLGILGGSQFMWNMKHNIIHHAYTNIDGVDDDIDGRPFLRMAATQKKYKMHRFQHWYFWFFYGWLYLFWIFFSDYNKYFSKKIGPIPIKKMKLKDHVSFWVYKIFSYAFFLLVPVFTVGLWPTFIGFLIASTVAGFILSIVFQLAHTVEHTAFPLPDEQSGKMEDEWAIHQLRTTANFATKNPVISWLVGGLNFQIEHHLFPKISHIHYPAISKIIRQTCREYGVVYVEYPRMYQAIFSHIAFLKQMGTK